MSLQRITSWLAVCGLALPLLAQGDAEAKARPNVLFISLDDLNDWIEPMNDGTRGKPTILAPNLDRLARAGVMFTNAHCSVTVCTPSRASLAAGRLPTLETGEIAEYDRPQGAFSVRSLPQHFADQGYETLRAGKILPPVTATDHWDQAVEIERHELQKPSQPSLNGLSIAEQGDPLDWGVIDLDEEEMIDHRVARWAAGVLAEEREKPFFLGVGFHLPHLPWYLPQERMEQYSRKEVDRPEFPRKDLDDVPQEGQRMAWSRPGTRNILRHHSDDRLIQKAGKTKEGIAAYCAAATYVDACVGIVLDALASGPHADDTIVVLWSDHGYHLGSKQHWRKRTLWEESTRVPLIISGPGVSVGRSADGPASLVDLYPTLVELTGIELPEHELHGRSLVGELRGEESPEDAVAFTTYEPGNATVRTRRWRYTRYAEGGEELYDHEADPMEWTNLIGSSPESEKVQVELAALLARLP